MAEKGLDYKSLAEAGTEKYRTGKRPVIEYPGTEVVDFYGFKRHNFVLDGCEGFIVEPRTPAPELPWSWCLQWADSFVPRTPALKLLERGFHHVHFNVFSTYMNEEGVRKLETFYAFLQSLHFHPKAALIGLSYGGLFSLRWAQEHPETVAAMYLDAPVCDLGFMAIRNESNAKADLLEVFRSEGRKIAAAYHVTTPEELQNHKLCPLNNYDAIVQAQIPILAIRSGQDQSVFPETNIDLLAERMKKAGLEMEIIRRDFYGHHPHGLDDPQVLADFILEHYPAF